MPSQGLSKKPLIIEYINHTGLNVPLNIGECINASLGLYNDTFRLVNQNSIKLEFELIYLMSHRPSNLQLGLIMHKIKQKYLFLYNVK